MEVYQWLLRHKGLTVSDMGYFVYVNGRKDMEAFDGKLEFDIDIISYKGKCDWIDSALMSMKDVLVVEHIPSKGKLCEFCPYRENAGKALLERQEKIKKKEHKEDSITRSLF